MLLEGDSSACGELDFYFDDWIYKPNILSFVRADPSDPDDTHLLTITTDPSDESIWNYE